MDYAVLALALLSLVLHFVKAKKPGNAVVDEATVLVDAAKSALPAVPQA